MKCAILERARRPTTILRDKIAFILLWLAQDAHATPCPRSPSAADANTSPSIAPSFVDLSAIVSLLAADTVEDKLVAPAAPLWERMSTMWTLFGLVGAVRAYAKLALGLGRAEAAGVNLGGGGAYTTVRTKMAKSFRRVESEGDGWWQDDRGSLLQAVFDDAAHTRWQRPIVIVAGYARCPFAGRRATHQVAQAAMNVAITIVLATLPLAALRIMEHFMTHDQSTGVWTATLVLCFTSAAIAGCAAPLALVLYTTAPFARLKDNDGRDFPSAVIHPNDSVMTANKGPCFILWQDPRETPRLRLGDIAPHRRPGDLKRVRVLSALASIGVLAYYILNYVTLSSATTLQSYIWLGLEILIMSARFVLWSSPRPFFDHSQRRMTVLYVVAGSLSSVLPAPGGDRSQNPRLTRPIVNTAVALAGSMLNNVHGSTAMLHQPTLRLLADAGTPADILREHYVNVAALHVEARDLKLIRLPWSFMEQLYTLEGLVLGKNPWSYGGLYLAACLVNGRFRGLTTVFALSKPEVAARFLATVRRKDDSPLSSGVIAAGITRELCIVDNLVNGGILGTATPLEGEDYERWHVQFRKNVAECRAAAVPNGPEDVEVHTRHAAPASVGSKHVVRTENTLQDALAFVNTVIDAEKAKEHRRCEGYCVIDAMVA